MVSIDYGEINLEIGMFCPMTKVCIDFGRNMPTHVLVKQALCYHRSYSSCLTLTQNKSTKMSGKVSSYPFTSLLFDSKVIKYYSLLVCM